MDYELRPASPEDDEFLQQLYSDVHAAEFAALRMPAPALAQLLAMQQRAQSTGYAAQHPKAESSILWVGPYPIGRLLVSASESELRLVDIALLRPFRAHGIGARVIQELQQRAREANLPLRLSVRAGNRAAHLYTRLGFVAISDGQAEQAMNIEMEWNASASPAPSSQPPTPSPGPPTPGPSSAYFRSIEGSRANAISAEGAVANLQLASVTLPPARHVPGVDPGDTFILTFEGPEATPLAQGMHTLDFADGYSIDLFLVPIELAGGTIRYEAIFNRASPIKTESPTV